MQTLSNIYEMSFCYVKKHKETYSEALVFGSVLGFTTITALVATAPAIATGMAALCMVTATIGTV